MSTNINPEIENVSFIGADRSASILLTLENEPDFLFYKHTVGNIENTGADLVNLILSLNKLSDKPITRHDFKNVLRTSKDPVTKKNKYNFIDIGHNISTPDHCEYEYHINFGMPANVIEFIAHTIIEHFDPSFMVDKKWVIDALTIMPDDNINMLRSLINPHHNWLEDKKTSQREANSSI
jgi:hypothetical protein